MEFRRDGRQRRLDRLRRDGDDAVYTAAAAAAAYPAAAGALPALPAKPAAAATVATEPARDTSLLLPARAASVPREWYAGALPAPDRSYRMPHQPAY